MKKRITCTLAALLIQGCSGGDGSGADAHVGDEGLKAEVWADNWFSLHVGETLIAEDSVPITTERSFNAETFYFDADYPITLSFTIKDYKENDTGLEYIGEANQQMGDGGFIAQLTDTATGNVIAVSSSAWKCMVIHKAPTNKDCEKDANPEETCLSEITDEPAGWKNADFDDSGWESATEHSEAAVGPKDGYDEISWDSTARLIWTSDLETDNTLLCRYTVSGPS